MKNILIPSLISSLVITSVSSAQCLGPGDPTSITSNRYYSGSGTLRDTSTVNPYNGGASFLGTYQHSGASYNARTWNTTNDGIHINQTWDTSINFNPTGGLAEFTSSVGNVNNTSWVWTDNATGNFFSIGLRQANAANPTLQFSWDNGSESNTVNVASFTNGQAESLTFQFAPSTSNANGFDITWSSTGNLLNNTYASTYTHIDSTLANATDISHSYRNTSQAAWMWVTDPVTGIRTTAIPNASLGIQGFADPHDPTAPTTSTYGPCPVPEPSSSLLIMLGACVGVFRRRR